jgi:hypothetical protein
MRCIKVATTQDRTGSMGTATAPAIVLDAMPPVRTASPPGHLPANVAERLGPPPTDNHRRSKRGPGAQKGADRGGARKGAGRKRIVLPPDALDRVGPRPVNDPLRLARWYSELLAELADLFIRSGGYVKMLREIKGVVGAAGKVMPLDVVLLAARKVKDDDQELGEDEDPEEEVRTPDAARPRAVRRDAP